MIQDVGYGAQFAAFYDKLFPGGPAVEQAVDFLAGRHVGGPSLELGVGTGRIALPLSARVGGVVGVDSSPEMLDILTPRIAEAGLPVTAVHGDIRDYADELQYGLVYCVCGTLSMLLDPGDQAAAVRAAAARLAPGAALVVETHNPAVAEALNQGRPRDSFFVPYPGRDTGLLSYSTVDTVNQIWHLAHIWFDDGRARIAQELSRLTAPEEVDAYAEAAGLRLAGRYGDWSGAPFTGVESMVISEYRAARDA
ncbi:class I SAM-dependent methyltransferase [Actinokineospora sp. NPDC004072]